MARVVELVVLVTLMLAPVAYLSDLTRRLQRRSNLLEESRALGLIEVRGRSGHLQGRLRDYRVELDARNPLAVALKITVPQGRVPIGLRIRPRGIPGHAEGDFVSEDDLFDAAFRINSGEKTEVRASLSGRARALLMQLGEHGEVEMTNHRLVYFPWTERSIKDALTTLIALADELSVAPPFLPHRLLRNALGDPHECVRLQNGLALLHSYPASVEADILQVHGLEDASRWVRLKLANHLDHQATLTDLVTDEYAPTEIRIEAIAPLFALLDASGKRAVLDVLLASPNPKLLARALSALDGISEDQLSQILPLLGDDDTIAQLTATHLGAMSAPEPLKRASRLRVLHALLERSDPVKQPAIEALAKIGDARSLPRLKRVKDGLFVSAPIRKRAAAAYLQILRRRQVQSGRLSLDSSASEPARGALSTVCAMAQTGALSNADPLEEEES